MYDEKIINTRSRCVCYADEEHKKIRMRVITSVEIKRSLQKVGHAK